MSGTWTTVIVAPFLAEGLLVTTLLFEGAADASDGRTDGRRVGATDFDGICVGCTSKIPPVNSRSDGGCCVSATYIEGSCVGCTIVGRAVSSRSVDGVADASGDIDGCSLICSLIVTGSPIDGCSVINSILVICSVINAADGSRLVGMAGVPPILPPLTNNREVGSGLIDSCSISFGGIINGL